MMSNKRSRAVINTNKLLNDIVSGVCQCDVYMYGGKIHRDDGPAIIGRGDTEITIWCRNGVIHRDGKMAAVMDRGRPYFYMNGRQYVPDARVMRTIHLSNYIINVCYVEGATAGYLSAYIILADESTFDRQSDYSCYDPAVTILLTADTSNMQLTRGCDEFIVRIGDICLRFYNN